MRIALVEDDAALGRLIALWLNEGGHACTLFTDGASFRRRAMHESYDMLLLDWMLPDTTGDRILEWVRRHRESNLPIMVVTSRQREEDIVQALDAGADDYVVKPVKRNELLARIAALGRRTSRFGALPPMLDVPPFRVDRAARCILKDGIPVALNNKEFELAAFFFENAERLLSRGHLMERVWGLTSEVDTRTVDTHVSRLRKKLGLGPETGWQLSSVPGFGYRLEHWREG